MPIEIYEPATEIRSRAKPRAADRHVSKVDRHLSKQDRHKDREGGRKVDNARC